VRRRTVVQARYSARLLRSVRRSLSAVR